MCSESAEFSLDGKMFLSFVKTANNRSFQQQLYQKLVNSVNVRNVALSKTSCQDNPQNLPHLPVPELNTTFNKYLNTVKPFLNDQELEVTTNVVKKFIEPNGVGMQLQNFLLNRANSTTNWLENWWLQVAYLGFRQSVVVYSSPGQSLPFETFNTEEDRLLYTAKLILAASSYKMLIDSKKIPVEKMGKAELDMNQYNKIFGTCRIPNLPIDDIQYNPKSNHIIIVHNNHFFKINIFNNDNLISENQILKLLQKILLESTEPTHPIGILTSDHRDEWAKSYKRLIDFDLENRKSSEEIQRCLFMVCLDKQMPKSLQGDSRRTIGGKQFIHGGGSAGNAGNRWYDKTVQFIIGKDGIVGLTYEHSPSEGQPIAVMVDYLYQFIQKDAGKSIPNSNQILDITKLNFKINNDIESDIEAASNRIDKLVDNLELNCFTFNDFGKEFVKSQKYSPDSFIQIAMQYAFYRIHKVPGAHYESAATRQYVGGRTETIRSCAQESIAFAKTMLDLSKKDNERLEALKLAVNGHKQYTIDALNGFGVDRHLLGLKLAAKELGLELPALYTDPSYLRSIHMRISSSQVATKCDGLMCYGPLVDDGYGCCYNPRANDINIAVSAFTAHPDTNSKSFKNALEESLLDMKNLLLRTQKSKL